MKSATLPSFWENYRELSDEVRMVLETKRLILREIALHDVDDLLEVLSDLKAMQFYSQPFDRQMTQTWIERNIQRYAQHGYRILEIGTGSGYSTALLSNIVGKNGVVISIDIDANMVERASLLLQQDGYTNVRVLLGDGRVGKPAWSPYDQIIAWASAEYEVPLPLVEQLKSNGILVCPLRKRDSSWIASFRKNEAGNLEEIEKIIGGFIPMTETPLYPWLGKS